MQPSYVGRNMHLARPSVPFGACNLKTKNIDSHNW